MMAIVGVTWGGDYAAGEKALEPHLAGFYTNLHDFTEKAVGGNYGPNYARLVELKNQYDPTNLFRLNANIKPNI